MQKTFHHTFTFLDWYLDKTNHTLSLNYQIEKLGKVTEVLSFPPFKPNKLQENEVEKACELIHLMCGVSYYKAGLAKEIRFTHDCPSKQMAQFVEKTWKHGLAELAFENGVSFKGVCFKGVSTLLNKSSLFKRVLTPLKQTLVPLGGGKDSLVTIEELKQQGKNIHLFMVGNSALIKQVAAFVDLPLIQVKRQIDLKLIEYNKTGEGFNGHVPITAIISSIAVLTALLFDCNEVVFSNEKSADSANTINSDGDEVNHQYSKSHEFEKDFSAILASEITSNIKYYSQQRSSSELEILEKFSHYPQYFPVFSSCNRNFHIDGSHNKKTKWCCNCPKCRFVFLGMAPFVEKSQLITIFGINLLDDVSQQKGFAELLGIQGFKPFECVGEIQESQQAFSMIQNRQAWKDDKLIRCFKESLAQFEVKKQQKPNSTLTPIKMSKKNIAIWGFGVEGKATAEYLKNKGIKFKVLCKEGETDRSYFCITKKVDQSLLGCFDLVVKSPGISPYTSLIKNSKCEFTSATAIWFANEKKSKVIAVTGTKGKSTTASLLAHVLSEQNLRVDLVGNIGQPLIASSLQYDYIVLESSSFQIYDGNIKADIAVITNLFPEHIDWHQGEENYFSDKLKILDSASVKILNATNTKLNELVNEPVNGEGVIYFNDSDSYHVKNDVLYYQSKKLLSLQDIQLMGAHNLENIAAVLLVCDQCNLDREKSLASIKSFQPLAHRLQSLGKIGKHFAINDSIATTPMATIAALKTINLSNTTLLIGGYDRGHDWSGFVENLIMYSPKLIIVSGGNADSIMSLLKAKNAEKNAEKNTTVNYKQQKNLKDSINYAVKNTQENGLILLSPGAPSFDQFESYVKRGDFFTEELMKYV
ncbi:MAG: UDP-N-acetylmuramoyl-L-alanine--D-glutamate ligase [Proteobacteria bacterium]|nr:UDP-N-acetylmuramoyl-L-alanine--D-glutamate ligase [Pseudomonadota bacterium]